VCLSVIVKSDSVVLGVLGLSSHEEENANRKKLSKLYFTLQSRVSLFSARVGRVNQ